MAKEITKNATAVANESANVADEATSINNFNSDQMEERKEIATDVANEDVVNATSENLSAAEDAACVNQNQTNMTKEKEIVAPKTRVAIIYGEEKNILVAHPKFGMAQPKDKNGILPKVDTSKIMSCIFHFSRPELFWDEGYDLYDENNKIIEKGTPNVLVHAQTPDDYWKIGLVEKLEHVEVMDFASVQEFAQTVGTTNLYSRGLNSSEKMGVAAVASGNEDCQIIFDFAKLHKMSISTAQHYLDYSIKPATVQELMMGNSTENVPTIGRTAEEAKALFDVIKSKFKKTADKRYIIRPINTLLHMVNKDYSLDLMKEALKSLSEMDTKTIENAPNGQREAMVSSTLTTHLDKLKNNQKEAA